MNKTLLVLLASAALLLALSRPAEAEGEHLKHEKYVLGNGLTVILHEDHALPLCAVNLWYSVGAKDEADGRSGFAHLFEHLMFMGTFRVPWPQFDVMMEGVGGANNATTSLDRTNYYSAGPANILPTLLWLDADRLESFGDAMNLTKLEKQRAVVLNEKKQVYDNAPYGLSQLVISEAFYPPGHPYRWETIGKDVDIENATVQDVKSFFATYYVPNNCSLVVAGDFDPKVVKPLIEGLFGSIPRGDAPPRRTAEPVTLPRVIRLAMKDKVSLPKISMNWPSPAFYAPGDAEMDLVASVLSDGKDSRLYRRLVFQEKLVQDVSAFQQSQKLGSMFTIEVVTMPDADLDRVEQVVDEELTRLSKEGPTEAELARARARIETANVDRLQSIAQRADTLNAYQFAFGDPDGLARDLDRYRKATPAGVRDQGAKVLDLGRRVICRVTPETTGDEEGPRAKRPEDGPERAFVPPAPDTFRLPNGLVVQHLDRPGVPMVAMQLVVPAGSSQDGPEKAGLASLTADMLDEGAGDLPALEYANALQSIGTALGAATERDGTTVGLQILSKHFVRGLDLFAAAVTKPRMEVPDFERVKGIRIEGLRAADDEPTELARRAGYEMFFGKGHPYGHVPDGTVEAVAGLTLADVKAFHGARYRPDGAVLIVAGDVRRPDLEKAVNAALGGWKGQGPAPAVAQARPAAPDALRVYLVDRPGAEQTAVRFLLPGIAYRSEERVTLDLLNTLFGASFSSRINQNLREVHGYTYGASSSFVALRDDGCFLVSTAVRTDVTGASLKELLNELNKVRGGDVTDEEAAKARTTRHNETVDRFQSLDDATGAFAELVLRGMPPGTLARDVERMGAVKTADLNALAKTSVVPTAGVIVLVGDREAILPQLEGLGLPAPLPWGQTTGAAGGGAGR